jgi:hypothetical protein
MSLRSLLILSSHPNPGQIFGRIVIISIREMHGAQPQPEAHICTAYLPTSIIGASSYF